MTHTDLTALDPSINDTGVARLVGGKIERATTLKTTSKGNDRYAEIARAVACEFAGLPPQPVVIEYPDKWTRKAKKKLVLEAESEKALNVESLKKLSVAIGVIAGVATIFGHEPVFIRVDKWKGKKSKGATRLELELLGYNIKALGWDEHACDAARLALWAEGMLRVGKLTKSIGEGHK